MLLLKVDISDFMRTLISLNTFLAYKVIIKYAQKILIKNVHML